MKKKGKSGLGFLSVELQTYIEDLDRNADELTQDEPALDTDERKRFEKLLIATTRSLEGFAEAWQERLIRVFQDIPETWEWMVDEYYCREAVGKVHGMVARFLQLNPVLAGVVPSQEGQPLLEGSYTVLHLRLFRSQHRSVTCSARSWPERVPSAPLGKCALTKAHGEG